MCTGHSGNPTKLEKAIEILFFLGPPYDILHYLMIVSRGCTVVGPWDMGLMWSGYVILGSGRHSGISLFLHVVYFNTFLISIMVFKFSNISLDTLRVKYQNLGRGLPHVRLAK